jgi:Zn-dependent peptidase ImmA (M78 family)
MTWHLSLDEMEKITQGILIDYGLNLNPKEPYPIPIEEIIEFQFELDILWEKIDHLDKTGDVMAAIFPDIRKIIMNESKKDLFEEKIGTRNFTFAHELGHWVLHANNQMQTPQKHDNNESIFYCRSGKGRPNIEKEADMFAGSLLMPKHIILNEMNKIGANKKITWKHLYKMQDQFNVSISALCYRLKDLGIVYIDNEQKIHRLDNVSGHLLFKL